MTKGSLRIYLGAAPGVGKTFAMLNEANRRRSRGTDVVAAYVEAHGRAQTEAQLRDLEVIPRALHSYRDTQFEELDLAAVLARKPAVALVDELAHTNAPGSAHEKRWQDVETLLDAGIDVISTVNIQHLESLNDVVERITAVAQRETVPDAMVRSAQQIELVDMTPEALRRRMAHGNIYAADKVDASMANYFRVGNLTALRELALLWVADRVDESMHDYMVSHGIAELWETRERVVVAVTGAPSGEHLIRRAARMAARTHGELLGVHVRVTDGLTAAPTELLEQHRRLLEDLGGSYHEVVGRDIATALTQFAGARNATQVVLGATRRSRFAELTQGSVINQVLRELHGIDVHVMRYQSDEDHPLPRTKSSHARLSTRRRLIGWSIAIIGTPALAAVLTQFRSQLRLPGDLMLYLLLVLVAATVGGMGPALLAAIAGSLAVNYYFTPPIHTLSVSQGDQVLALGVFITVGVVLAVLVTKLSAQAVAARRAQAEAEALTRLATELVGEADPVHALLARLRSSFDLDRVELQDKESDGWRTELETFRADNPIGADAGGTETTLGLDTITRLVLHGRTLDGDDQRVLRAFTAELGAALERRGLQRSAADAAVLSEGDALRTALLRSVSHDLRTPLASIKASVTSLLQDDIDWPPAATGEFLETIDQETDRLDRLVGNLLDMSRLETGAVQVRRRTVGWEEVVDAAVASLSQTGGLLDIQVPETLPAIDADPALLERAVANVVSNALRHTADGTKVRIEAGEAAGRVDLRVIDRGPGVAPDERTRVFQPFQRLGDEHRTGNLGLGLAVAKGFVEVMGGEIELEDTPGGGATMIIRMRTSGP